MLSSTSSQDEISAVEHGLHWICSIGFAALGHCWKAGPLAPKGVSD